MRFFNNFRSTFCNRSSNLLTLKEFSILGINLTTISFVSPILLMYLEVLHSDLCSPNLVSLHCHVHLYSLNTHALFMLLVNFLSCPSNRVSSFPVFLLHLKCFQNLTFFLQLLHPKSVQRSPGRTNSSSPFSPPLSYSPSSVPQMLCS